MNIHTYLPEAAKDLKTLKIILSNIHADAVAEVAGTLQNNEQRLKLYQLILMDASKGKRRIIN